MRRLLHLATRCYPRRWRERYAAELHGLIDDMPVRWTDLLDLVCRGVTMRLTNSRVAVPALAMAAAGALIGALAGLASPTRFESRSSMVVTPTGDAARVTQQLQAVLDRAMQSTFGPGVDGRVDVAVSRTSTGNEVQLAYRNADPRQAQATLEKLMSRVVIENLNVARQDSRARSAGLQIKVTTASKLPSSPSRPLLPWLAAFGAGAGALLGAAIGVSRRPSKA